MFSGAICFFLLHTLGALAFTLWVVRKLRLHPSTLNKAVAAVVVGAMLVGTLGMFVGLLKVAGVVSADLVDPSQKARILAEGISQAMNFSALSLIVWISAAALGVLIARKQPQHGQSR